MEPAFADMRNLTGTAASGTAPPTRRLTFFVLASLAVHGLLLWTIMPQTPEPALPIGEVALHVSMQAAERQPKRTIAGHTSLLTQPAERRVRIQPDDPADTGQAPTERSRSAETAPTLTGSAAAGSDRDALQNYLLGLLQSELSRTLRYPALARERGWQGTVLLGVAVSADGMLHNTRLLRSSGHALLDTASLDSLRQVHLLPLSIGWHRSEPIEVILPIRFRLADNS